MKNMKGQEYEDLEEFYRFSDQNEAGMAKKTQPKKNRPKKPKKAQSKKKPPKTGFFGFFLNRPKIIQKKTYNPIKPNKTP